MSKNNLTCQEAKKQNTQLRTKIAKLESQSTVKARKKLDDQNNKLREQILQAIGVIQGQTAQIMYLKTQIASEESFGARLERKNKQLQEYKKNSEKEKANERRKTNEKNPGKNKKSN